MLTLPRKKFAIEEYHQIIASGVLREDYLIELINGEIFEMSPVGFRNASCGAYLKVGGGLEKAIADYKIYLDYQDSSLFHVDKKE